MSHLSLLENALGVWRLGISVCRWLHGGKPSLVEAGIVYCGTDGARRYRCSWKGGLGESSGCGGRNGKHELGSSCTGKHVVGDFGITTKTI